MNKITDKYMDLIRSLGEHSPEFEIVIMITVLLLSMIMLYSLSSYVLTDKRETIFGSVEKVVLMCIMFILIMFVFHSVARNDMKTLTFTALFSIIVLTNGIITLLGRLKVISDNNKKSLKLLQEAFNLKEDFENLSKELKIDKELKK